MAKKKVQKVEDNVIDNTLDNVVDDTVNSTVNDNVVTIMDDVEPEQTINEDDNTSEETNDNVVECENNVLDEQVTDSLYIPDNALGINTIAFTKVRDVKIPARANTHDAGVDFYVPNYNETFASDLMAKNQKTGVIIRANGEITIPAHSRILIPSGIKVWINNKNSSLIAFNKSGVAVNKGLTIGACVVDADYTGEVHLSVINTTGNRLYLNCGDKLVQFLHLPVILSDFVEVDNDVYNEMSTNTDRGNGGFGSTGTN